MDEPFWSLDYLGQISRLAWWNEDEVDCAPIFCPINPGHQRAGPRLNDLSVILPRKPVQDLLWTWMSECLIQENVRELFLEHGLTGFTTKPVKARFDGKGGANSVPMLWELVVTGWGGMARDASGISLATSCSNCGHLVYSGLTSPEQLFDESQWDGSDFLMIWPLPKYVIVTNRVAELVRKSSFTGCRLRPISRILEDNLAKTSGFSPGRLSYWMPENRARELGEPLGIF